MAPKPPVPVSARATTARSAVRLDVVLPSNGTEGQRARIVVDPHLADVLRRIARAERTSVNALLTEMVRDYAKKRGWPVKDREA